MASKASTNDKDKSEIPNEERADFETAITATGFGLFNYILYFFAIFACFGSVYEASSTSYILPAAECDLQITLQEKGLLNAITYAGMMTSAILWGVIADSKGRQKILAYGFFADAICGVCVSLSQSTTFFIVFKFLGGFIVNGPFAILVSYLSEFHNTQRRARVMMLVGIYFAMANLSLPGLAWSIFPQDWKFYLGSYVVNTWQIFLAVCAIPSWVSCIIVFFLPESPKFLMSKGKNHEALEVFRKVYAINHMKSADEYPIKKLIREDLPEEVNEKPDITTVEGSIQRPHLERMQSQAPERPFWVSLIDDIKKMRILFRKEYLGRSMHAYAMQFCMLMGLNTIRLWLPQLFTIIAEYEENVQTSDSSANLCAMISHGVNKTEVNTQNIENCEVHFSPAAYMNNVIVSLVGIVGYFLAGTIVNVLGEKLMMISGLFICGVLGISFYWSTTSTVTLVISSLYTNIAGICATSLLSIVVNCFPTNLRTIVICVVMLFGRFGALIGNVIFPYLLEWGCLQSFAYVAIIMFIGSMLSFLFPKNTNKQNLK